MCSAGSVPTIAQQPVAGQGIVVELHHRRMAADDRVRVELVLTVPSLVQQAYLLDAVGDQPARLVVDLVTTTREDFAARAAADLANSIVAGRARCDTSPRPSPSEAPSSERQPPSRPVAERPVVEPGRR